MNAATNIPADGPDAVLARIVADLRLPYDRGHILRSLAIHPRPSSLLAVVDVGGQLGLKMTPVKIAPDALADQTPPMIVHFDRQGAGGFGVLEQASAGRFELWDSKHGLRTLDRETFLAYWSGVAVLVESRETRPRETTRLAHLVAKAVSGADPASVTGPSSSRLRSTMALLVGAALMVAVLAQPPQTRAAAALVALLSAVGLAITTLMTIAISDYAGPFAPGICRRGHLVDCQSVLTSRFARFLGIPLSDLGIAFYAGILLLLASSGGRQAALAIVNLLFFAAVPLALLLIALQVWMRRLCTLCLGVHAVNLTVAAIGWFHLPRSFTASGTLYYGLVFAVLLFLVLFFAVPYLKQHKATSRLAAAHARIAASPFASLAQLVTEPATDLDAPATAVSLGGRSAPHELVAFVHPSCKQCQPVLRELRSLAAGGRLAVYVTIPPRDAGERRLSEVLIATGLSAGPDKMLEAFDIAKRRLNEPEGGDPLAAVEAELPLATLDLSAAEASRAIVERAGVFARDHVEGTPAIFFNAIPYRGPLAHLLTLIHDHPDLVARVHRPNAAAPRIRGRDT